MSEKSRCGSPLPEGGCFGGTSTVFRSVRSLHEEYRFEEDKDKIGHGAFSIVYRATPVARTVAMERTWQTAVAASHDYHNNNNNNGSSTLHSSLSLPSPTSSPSSLYVALKVLPRDVRNEEKAARQRRDVQREAVVLSSIRGHKGCTMLVETLQTEQHFAIVMLLVDRSCVDCGQYLAANVRLTEPHAALIVYQLLRTVQSLHRDVHLLHHDVKLENIVLSSSQLPPVPTTATTLVGLLGSDADGSGSSEPAPPSSLGASRCHSADSLHLLDGGGGLLPSTPPSVGSDTAVISEGGCGHSSSFSAPPSLHLGTVGGPCKSGQNDPLLLACKSKSSSSSVAPRPPLNVPTTVVPSAPATVQRNGVVADSGADEVVFLGASTTVPRQHRHVVLIDFGLARFLDEDPSNGPCMSSSPHHDHHHHRHPDKKNSSDDTPLHPHCSHHHHHRTPSSSIVHVGCCGTDRYLPSELLEMSLSNDDGVLGTGVDPSTTVPSKEMSSEQACKVDGYAIGVVTYLLLSGCFPYGAKTKPLLYRQQRLTPLRMDSAAWRSVSSVAKEFVKGLLATDPATRWTTQEALQHPWMQEARSLAHFLKVPVDQ